MSAQSPVVTDAVGLQTSLLLCQAVSSPSNVTEFLHTTVALHNLCEYTYVPTAPCPYLLALSGSHVEPSAECRLTSKLQQSVYVAFANSTSTLTGAPPVSFTNHYAGQRPLCCDLAPGAEVPALVAQLLSSLPIQSLLSLLGQGYRVVLSGHGFGGLVAHTVAAKLVLQVRQEIMLAKEMGINLSALSMTEDKVVSYAFGSPLFANEQLRNSLQELKLDGNMHTFWRQFDASPHFFALCSEMAMAAEGPDAGSVTAPAQDGSGVPLDPQHEFEYGTVAFSLRSQQFQALQQWAGVVAAEVGKLPRSSSVTLAATPLSLVNTQSRREAVAAASAAALIAGDITVSPRASASNSGLSAADAAAAVVEVDGGRSSNPSLARSRASGTAVAGATPVGRSGSGMASVSRAAPGSGSPARASISGAAAVVKAAATMKAALAGAKAGSSGAAATRSSASNLSSSPGGSKTVAAGAPAAAAPADKPAQRRSALTEGISKSIPSGSSSGITSGGADSAWRAPLEDLLRRAPDSLAHYVPIGHFWQIEPVAKMAGGAPAAAAAASGRKPAAGGAAYKEDVNVQLTSIPGNRAVWVGHEWLTPGNKEMFARWEWSLEEMKKDMMEAFAWLTFKVAVTIDGQLIDRKHLIRPSKRELY